MAQATLNGLLVDDGGEPCSVRFEYGNTVAYGLTTPWQIGMVAGDTFSAIITDLGSNTVIHFRAVARNSFGTVYGSDMVFTTLNADRFPSSIFDPTLQLLWA